MDVGIRALLLNRGLGLLLLAGLAGLYAIFAIDLFQDEGGTVTGRRMRVELDEFLLYGSSLILLLFGFSFNQHRGRLRERTKRLRAERDARDLGYHDPLTGMPNRRAFGEALDGLAPSGLHAVLMLDLNGFKAINDTHGHGTGDALLRVIADRIAGAVREGDTAARLGGDEFAVIAPGLASPEVAKAIAKRLAESIARPVFLDGRTLHVGSGIGIALSRAEKLAPEELTRRADLALYAAKRSEGVAFRLYGPELEA
ncbi:GGDEF domain-containing protein [Sphingomonas sp. HITSZ_GF]|uniref:GGDEF domain-containing protein n=1 Tax=Sphingomonas sp. HITSZ_GF TaxID=3037247 RepID=UPI00240D1852|nr:GGDEF domain-containing protein [Sphingomonas sp. HITSZ_GF]MDG2533938.1 GGDEF domain-containing protein [Sphingomonas sp. HITSZ_GF]